MKGISAINELNEALFDVMKNDLWLKDKNVSIHQSVVKEATFPYVVLGENAVTNKVGSTYWQETQVITLHCYSQSNSKYEANEILNRLSFLLDEKFNLEGFIIIDSRVFKSPVVFEDIDEFTKHGVLQMQYIIKNKVKYREE